MYIKEYLEKFDNKKIKLFVDMDGVIVDYVVGSASDFHKRRPLISSIEKLKEISKNENIELFVLSVTRMDEGYNQKQEWLNKYAPFFEEKNRIILSRESNAFKSAADLKADFIKKIERDNSVIVFIDDDPIVLKKMMEINQDVILLKDTVLVD